MTREEAIQILQTALTSPLIYGEHLEAIDMAIEALSQPIVCTDFRIDPDYIYCAPETAQKVHDALHNTNVQNMHKGEWIKYESPVDYDDGKDAWDCSLCGAMVGKPTNYCPNCGADMRGEKE